MTCNQDQGCEEGNRREPPQKLLPGNILVELEFWCSGDNPILNVDLHLHNLLQEVFHEIRRHSNQKRMGQVDQGRYKHDQMISINKSKWKREFTPQVP